METTEERLAAIEKRLERGSERMAAIEMGMAENTRITRDVHELLELGRNGLRVLGYLGVAARWVGGIAAAVAAVFGAWHATHDGLPK